MSEPPVPSTSALAVRRKRNLSIAAAALVVLIVAGIFIGVAVSDANARAEEKAAAQAQAKAERIEAEKQKAEAEKQHAEALDDAKTAIDAGEARYTESETYGDPEKRNHLRSDLDALVAVLDSPKPTTRELTDAVSAVKVAVQLVGTKEEHEAALVAAAEKAKDDQYATMAESLKGNGMVAAYDGREYCTYLHKYYTPDNVYPTLWGDAVEARQIDVAAVRVYCPEFNPKLDMVLSGFYDGDHVVGQTIQPGKYKTAGGVKDCYWERNNGSGEILDNNFVSAAHNGVTVTVGAGEGFTTEGCGLWIPAG